MSKVKGSEYNEETKKIFTESKTNAKEIKSKFKNDVDPINQNNSKFDFKFPQISQTTMNYYEYTCPKKERIHKKVNFQKSTIFNEGLEPPAQPRPQKRQVELYIQEQEAKPRKRIIASPISTNPIIDNGDNTKIKRAKNSKSKPGDCDGLLQSPDPNNKNFIQVEHYNPSLCGNDVFNTNEKGKNGFVNYYNRSNTSSNLLKNKQYRYDKYSSYKADHIGDLFNSKVNEKVVEQNITSKPNADSYSTFVNEARGICYERYHDYY